MPDAQTCEDHMRQIRERRQRDDDAERLLGLWRTATPVLVAPEHLECECDNPHLVLAMQVGGGQHQIRAYCPARRLVGERSYGRHIVGNVMVGRDVPELVNPELKSCERCGSYAAELHHWAPVSMFDDAHLWPTSWLCRPCHMEWHSIATPGLVGNR